MTWTSWFTRLIGQPATRGTPNAADVIPFVTDSVDPLQRDLRGVTLETLSGLIGGGAIAQPAFGTPLRLSGTGINGITVSGQSLGIGATARPLITTSQPYANLTFTGGIKSVSTGDTAGFRALYEDLFDAENSDYPENNRGESVTSCSANSAVRLAGLRAGIAPADFTIFACNAAQGGTSILLHVKGAIYYTRLINQVARAKAAADAAGRPIAFNITEWIHGENNAGNGMDYATYKPLLIQRAIDLDADIRAITGQTTPCYTLVYQTCWSTLSNTGVAQAQIDAAREHPLIDFAGPIYHLPHSDGLHLTNVGYNRFGTGILGRAIYQRLVEGREPDCIMPLHAVADGTTLRVRFCTPTRLVLDRVGLPLTTDNGFQARDDAGFIAISAQRIEGGDTWAATMVRPMGAGATVRYAVDYVGVGQSALQAGCGNLRDSTNDPIVVDGVGYATPHVAPAFTLPVVAV
jgi:hypothetical protein